MNHFELRPFSRFFNSSSLFDQDFDQLLKQKDSFFSPTAEIYEAKDAYHVSLDIPGMTQDNIDIEVKENELHITGERKSVSKKEGEESLRTERRYGKFSRVFTIPTNVKADRIEARFENGVLDLVLPKVEEMKSRKIQISTHKPNEIN